jgi:NAD-dependent deacetylase
MRGVILRDKQAASLEELTQKAQQIMQQSHQILFFVGAGLSQASGIKTFRDEDGYYQDHKVEDLANVDSFFHQREVMLSWYQMRRNQLLNVQPNEGHRAMARLAGHKNVVVATQNVDDLLERAQKEVGVSCPVWHVHGSIADVLCHQCGHVFLDASFDLSGGPLCEKCGGPLRPGVVWFGEALPPLPLQQSLDAAQACDVCVMVGTSGVVYPAAMIPEQALATGATLIEVNPAPSALSSKCEIVLRGKAHEILPQLM